MRQTPFYEMSVALKDRPKGFQFVVLSTFLLSVFFLLLMASGSLQERQNKKEHTTADQQKDEGKQILINASSYAGKE
jgi:hypothetical protein